MIWQDLVFAIGNVGFSVALLPSLLSVHKPAAWTSLLTATILAAFTGTYATLHLWLAASTCAAEAVLWKVLLLQKKGEKPSWEVRALRLYGKEEDS